MRRSQRLVIAAGAASLGGCRSSDEAILDIAGGVFLIFALLVTGKYVAPLLVRTRVFDRVRQSLKSHSTMITRGAYGLAVLLIVVGAWPGGSTLSRIHVLTGLVVAVMASHIRPLAHADNEETRRRATEILSLGLGVAFVLVALWYFGFDLFREL